MNVVIAGGHGKVALRLTRRLHDRGDTVRSLIRNPAHAGDVEAAGGQPFACDLEQVSADELARAIAGSDAAVFGAAEMLWLDANEVGGVTATLDLPLRVDRALPETADARLVA